MQCPTNVPLSGFHAVKFSGEPSTHANSFAPELVSVAPSHTNCASFGPVYEVNKKFFSDSIYYAFLQTAYIHMYTYHLSKPVHRQSYFPLHQWWSLILMPCYDSVPLTQSSSLEKWSPENNMTPYVSPSQSHNPHLLITAVYLICKFGGFLLYMALVENKDTKNWKTPNACKNGYVAWTGSGYNRACLTVN